MAYLRSGIFKVETSDIIATLAENPRVVSFHEIWGFEDGMWKIIFLWAVRKDSDRTSG